MKIVICVLLLSFLGKSILHGQSINETIKYINEKAEKFTADNGLENEKDRNWSAVVGYGKTLTRSMELYKYYSYLMLDSKGILTLREEEKLGLFQQGLVILNG